MQWFSAALLPLFNSPSPWPRLFYFEIQTNRRFLNSFKKKGLKSIVNVTDLINIASSLSFPMTFYWPSCSELKKRLDHLCIIVCGSWSWRVSCYFLKQFLWFLYLSKIEASLYLFVIFRFWGFFIRL